MGNISSSVQNDELGRLMEEEEEEEAELEAMCYLQSIRIGHYSNVLIILSGNKVNCYINIWPLFKIITSNVLMLCKPISSLE